MAYKLKTTATDENVVGFLNTVDPKEKREDCLRLLDMMQDITGEKAVLWGKIIGFGKYKYKASSYDAEYLKTGFAPRAAGISVYLMTGYEDYSKYLTKLGKHKKGKSCLNIKKLEDLDLEVLKTMIKLDWDKMSERYPD